MARKFLIDGNWLICSEGTCMQRIQVNSQSTIYAHGKLVATMNDRMDGNFYCFYLHINISNISLGYQYL